MEKKQKLEIDIELKDLFWEVIRNWRIIICCMLVGGILLGAVSYVQSYKAANATVATPTVTAKTPEEVMAELNIDELERVISAVQLKAQIDAKSQYISESVLMQINPFEKNSVSLEYIFDGAEALRAMESYANWIENGEFLADSDAEDAMYKSELVSVSTNMEAGVLFVTITHVDEASCVMLANEVKEALSAYTNTLTNQGIGFECRLLSELQGISVDEELHAYQDAYLKACIDDQDKLKKMKADMNGNQVKVYLHLERDVFDRGGEEEKAEAEDTVVTPPAEPKKVSVSMSKVIIGMILGAVLAVVYIFLRYLLCGTIRVPGEMEVLYGVDLLGTVREEEKKKAAFAAVDKVIWKLEHAKEKRGSREEELKLAAASIAIQCQKYDFDTIYVTGTNLSNVAQETLEALSKEVAARGIKVASGVDVSENAESLLVASKVGNIVLVEKKRTSAYKNILKCVRACGTNHIQVLGSIIVEK